MFPPGAALMQGLGTRDYTRAERNNAAADQQTQAAGRACAALLPTGTSETRNWRHYQGSVRRGCAGDEQVGSRIPVRPCAIRRSPVTYADGPDATPRFQYEKPQPVSARSLRLWPETMARGPTPPTGAATTCWPDWLIRLDALRTRKDRPPGCRPRSRPWPALRWPDRQARIRAPLQADRRHGRVAAPIWFRRWPGRLLKAG